MVAVFRDYRLTAAQRELVANKALSMVGDGYGNMDLLANAADWLLGGRYVFRRWLANPNRPICSMLVALAYGAIRRTFLGLDYSVVQPDDIWDECSTGEFWLCPIPFGKLTVKGEL